MRVIAGEFRSRVLTAPRGTSTRPTSDRLRETLFNVLAARIAGSVFVDLYAGSGAVGIEAASRGASQVFFAETDKAALGAVRSNLQALGLRAEVESGGTATLLKRMLASRQRADLIFLDPPYESKEEYQRTLSWLGGEGVALLAKDSIVVAEHSRKLTLGERAGELRAYRSLRQGDAVLTFYRLSVSANGEAFGSAGQPE